MKAGEVIPHEKMQFSKYKCEGLHLSGSNQFPKYEKDKWLDLSPLENQRISQLRRDF